MKKLILMRHAKSSWEEDDIQDISRSLNERGRKGAALLGQWMEKSGNTPDQVITSAATRCRETWDGIGAALSAQPDVLVERALYMAGPEEILDILRTRAKGDTVLVLAHQPGIGLLAREMRVDPPPAHEAFAKYPTGATTVLDLPIDDWSQIVFGIAHQEDYVTPRALGI